MQARALPKAWKRGRTMPISGKIIVILFAIAILLWNLELISDIKETIQYNKQSEKYLKVGPPAELSDSSIRCIIADFSIITAILIEILTRVSS